jgi:hypothetical protein
MRSVGHEERMEEMRNSYISSVGKSERKRHLGRHKLKREDNIKTDLEEIEW